MSNRRRKMIIEPKKNNEFRTLCSSDHPVTEKLFGDDLGKKVEDRTKANKIGCKLSGNNGNRNDKRFHGNRKYQGQRQGYMTQSFLDQEETADVQQTGEEVVPPIDEHVSEFRDSSDNLISTHIHY